MNAFAKLLVVGTLLLASTAVNAQAKGDDDADALKIAAIEALMSAPADRALPLVHKVLAGNHSNDVKERALFILSQINAEEAQTTLLTIAREQSGDLQLEAIRMIGIGGNESALADLSAIYNNGDGNVREAVLDAYMIAGDKIAVFNIAVNAKGDDFEEAVDMLGAMGAQDELRELRSRAGTSDALIDAYAISGDFETLRELASDAESIELKTQAIEAMGIVGGDKVDSVLVEIYRTADSAEIREAALDGMLIANHDAGVLELYRASDSPSEKKELLEYLVMMGSDEVWDVIDQALDGSE